jgi:archaeosine-15-forming tRNA-guanine transglycosylase
MVVAGVNISYGASRNIVVEGTPTSIIANPDEWFVLAVTAHAVVKNEPPPNNMRAVF